MSVILVTVVVITTVLILLVAMLVSVMKGLHQQIMENIAVVSECVGLNSNRR